MVVDVYTMIWNSLDELGPAVAARLREMDTLPWAATGSDQQALAAAVEPIDRALVHGLRSKLLGAAVPNEFVARVAAGSGGKCLAVACIDPMDDDWRKHLDAALAQGVAAVSTSPAAQGYHPCHSHAMRLFEACEAASKPVFVISEFALASQTRLEFAAPVLLDEVARAFPQLRLVLTRVGWPFVDQAIALIAKHEHIYGELSGIVGFPWQLYNVLVNAHQRHAIDRLLLGSGFPWCTPADAISNMYSVNRFSHGTPMPSIPRERLRGIVERDALRSLGLAAADHPAFGEAPAEAPKEQEQPVTAESIAQGGEGQVKASTQEHEEQ